MYILAESHTSPAQSGAQTAVGEILAERSWLETTGANKNEDELSRGGLRHDAEVVRQTALVAEKAATFK